MVYKSSIHSSAGTPTLPGDNTFTGVNTFDNTTKFADIIVGVDYFASTPPVNGAIIEGNVYIGSDTSNGGSLGCTFQNSGGTASFDSGNGVGIVIGQGGNGDGSGAELQVGGDISANRFSIKGGGPYLDGTGLTMSGLPIQAGGGIQLNGNVINLGGGNINAAGGTIYLGGGTLDIGGGNIIDGDTGIILFGSTIQANSGIDLNGSPIHVSGALTDSTGSSGNSGDILHSTGASTVKYDPPITLGIPASAVTPVSLLNQTAAKGSTTLLAIAATGLYRVTYTASIKTAATTSSVLGGTNGFKIAYTDGHNSVAKATIAGNTLTSAANTTGTTLTDTLTGYMKTGTNLTYTFDYTSVGVTAMAYDLDIFVERLT